MSLCLCCAPSPEPSPPGLDAGRQAPLPELREDPVPAGMDGGASRADGGPGAVGLDAGVPDAHPVSDHEDAGGEDAGGEDAGGEDAGGEDAGAPSDGGSGPAAPFRPGLLEGARPTLAALAPLPGGGVGGPVLKSNNPELLTGPGLLYGNARPTLTRGGEPYPLSGEFGVYLHHLVDTGDDRVGGGDPLWITLLVSNPNPAASVQVEMWGSGYAQGETVGVGLDAQTIDLGLGRSPDFRVSADWITDGAHDPRYSTWSRRSVELGPSTPFIAFQREVGDYREVDGRFGFSTSGPVFVYVVATETPDINDCVRMTSGEDRRDAPGDYRISGDPPPPFGREAGIYAHDIWRGTLELDLPATPSHAAYLVNSATGQGVSQVQAFPALSHLEGSAREAVGMYGNVYDLALRLRHDGTDAVARQVRITFSSLATAQISRYWDGLGLVNGAPLALQHTPSAPSTVLATARLEPGETREVRFTAMVPGLTSISQALVVESLGSE